MIGWIVNQVSEFSLIIGNMAYGWNIFTVNMYLAIVIGTLITFIFSSMGHIAADQVYDKVVVNCIGWFDNRAKKDEEVCDCALRNAD
jgi:hypothetical protein